MLQYLIRRVLIAIPVLIGASMLIFAMVYALPGDPLLAMFGDKPVSQTTIDQLRARYNLDDPLWLQYVKYVANLLQGDLGQTFRGREVSHIIAERLPHTIRLTIVAFLFQVIIGITAGAIAGVRKGGWFDNITLVTTIVLVSIPVLVLAYIAQYNLAFKLKLFPISGIAHGMQSYLLPGFVLGSLSLAYIARLTRTSLVESMKQDYIRTARAKGLKFSTIVGRHAMRNSLIPVITYIGAELGALMGGAVVTETVFNIPGIGYEAFNGIRNQEGNTVVSIVTVMVFFYIFFLLVVDVLQALLDPRVRYE